MKWPTHEAGGLLLALLFQLPAAGIGAAVAGTIAPDVIDIKVSSLGVTRKGRQKLFNKIHRGPSHWFGWWLLLFLAGVYFAPALWAEALAGFALGALCHVGMDMLTTRGVPIMPFSRRKNVSLRFCATGSWKEYFLFGFLVLAIVGTVALGYGDTEALRRIRDFVAKTV